MVLRIRLYVTVTVLWLVKLSELVSPCPNVCANQDIAQNQDCPYNVTLKDQNNITSVLMMCCDGIQFSDPNRTYSEMTVHISDSCKTAYVILDLPSLLARNIIIRHSIANEIKIKINASFVQNLELSDNKLKLITKRYFSYYTNLEKLNLTSNEISNIEDGSFVKLTKLQYLDLSNNNLTTLYNIFTPLKNLQHLNLSRNNIEFIDDNYFDNWLLQHLDVSHNNLKRVSPGALQSLPNLARLLLTDNPHLGINQLDTQLLVGTGRRLQQIDASRTGLNQVPEAFTHSVRFLSLVGNRIAAVRCGDLDSYPLLQSLDFTDNKIASVEDDSLGRLEMLLLINFNNNLLTAVPRSLPDELKYLSINNNLIKNLTKLDFKAMSNLRILLLQNNKISYIEDHTFDDLLALEMLDLSNNPIQTLSTSSFDGPLSLRDLRLCYLNVSVPEKDGSFPMSSPESIQMLHLQSSPSLARQLLADSAALAALSHLQYLDLRMNNLSEIRNDLLFYLGQLKTLRLYGNSFNCTAELWLKDWLNWNGSVANSETCYYSTVDPDKDEPKYNCTFSETFTINDSLPPVNLYTTEMINKLLKYYGYLNNTTEQIPHKVFNDSNLITNKNLTYQNKLKNKPKFIDNNLIPEYFKKDIHIPNINVRSAELKAKDISKILDHNESTKIFDYKYPETNTANDFDVYNNDLSRPKPNNRSGRRLNTPTNITAIRTNKNITRNVKESRSTITDYAIHEESNMKSEYSPYQSATTNYTRFIVVTSLTILILLSMVLWVSFRWKRIRRSRGVDEEEHIEVANISGGVLW